MLIGREKLQRAFKRLVKDDRLSHGYIFFGEPEVGKFSFALALASYLESGDFTPRETLYETLILSPDEKESIGIEKVRELRQYLNQSPIRAAYRIGIINVAERLTDQAQNAILKIAEEPPPTGIIILVITNPEALLPTLQSRFQKIYFPRLTSIAIVNFLKEEAKLNQKQAEAIAAISFGRPARALSLINEKGMTKSALNFGKDKRRVIEVATERSDHFKLITETMADLAREPVKNYVVLRSLLARSFQLSQSPSLNKRLQLEAALWNI